MSIEPASHERQPTSRKQDQPAAGSSRTEQFIYEQSRPEQHSCTRTPCLHCRGPNGRLGRRPRRAAAVRPQRADGGAEAAGRLDLTDGRRRGGNGRTARRTAGRCSHGRRAEQTAAAREVAATAAGNERTAARTNGSATGARRSAGRWPQRRPNGRPDEMLLLLRRRRRRDEWRPRRAAKLATAT